MRAEQIVMKTVMRGGIIIILLLLSLFAGYKAYAMQPGQETIVAPEILNRLYGGEESVDVIILLKGYKDYEGKVRADRYSEMAAIQAEIRSLQHAVLKRLIPSQFKLRHRYENIAGFSGKVTREGINILASMPEIAIIQEDGIVYAHLAQGIPLQNAFAIRSGYNGGGVSVAVVDTGIDYTHPMLGGGAFPNAKVIGGHDFGDNDSDPTDCNGHGTSVAGIAAGTETTGQGDYIGGVAHSARLYALKIVSGCGGSANFSTIAAAWDWAVTHQYDDPDNPIMIVNTSFGGGKYTSFCDNSFSALSVAANNAVANGLTLFVSSGNDGHTDGISSPACISKVISIGAVYDADIGSRSWCLERDNQNNCIRTCTDASTSSDQITCYSNSANFLDILAPGNDASTTATGGGYTASFGGTSAASPYAAGAAAVLQSYARSVTGSFYTPDEVEARLRGTGDPITDTRNNITRPRVDLGNAVAARLPRTGQTTCYDSMGAVIPCAGTGQDGEIQAGMSWPSARFIDHGDGMVTDNLTGLMWTKNANLPGASKTWQEALDYVKGMNAETYPNFGHTDWRIPNINEMESLFDAEQQIPSLPIGHPFTNVQNDHYWSSTSSESNRDSAWVVSNKYDAYYIVPRYKVASSNGVWAVRTSGTGNISLPKTGQINCYDTGGILIPCSSTGQDGHILVGVAWPNPRFKDNGNGTVTDNLTELMWTKNANLRELASWQQALDYVAGMNAGIYPNFGYTDWRLPNRKELQSLIDRNTYHPALPMGHPFTIDINSTYWLSSTSYPGVNYVWNVDMVSGTSTLVHKSPNYIPVLVVWPVRSGQVGPSFHSILGNATENGTGLGGVIFTLSGSFSDTTTTASDGAYSFSGLPDGNYTITPSLSGYLFTPVNQSVTISGSSQVDINFAATKIRFEDNDPAISYTGTWNLYPCNPCKNGTLRYSNQTGARAEFSFSGTGIKWIVAKGPMMGKAKVYLDGVYTGLIDLYSPSMKYNQVLPKTGLTPGNHTVAIEVSGQKNPASTGYFINIDVFEVVP